MADRWMIRGVEYGNCNCDSGCPCQFNSPTTMASARRSARARSTRATSTRRASTVCPSSMLLQWPGEIAEGNGRQQMIIDERANPAQREALRKILHGESTAPGATTSTSSTAPCREVLDPIYAPIELTIDVEARRARVRVPGLVESRRLADRRPRTAAGSRAGIRLPNGFEFTVAEVGGGSSRSRAAIQIDPDRTHAPGPLLHMNQDGVIR